MWFTSETATNHLQIQLFHQPSILKFLICCNILNFYMKYVSRFSLKIGISGKMYLPDIEQKLRGGCGELGCCSTDHQSPDPAMLHAWGDLPLPCMHLTLRFLLNVGLLQTLNIFLCLLPNFINWRWLVLCFKGKQEYCIWKINPWYKM